MKKILIMLVFFPLLTRAELILDSDVDSETYNQPNNEFQKWISELKEELKKSKNRKCVEVGGSYFIYSLTDNDENEREEESKLAENDKPKNVEPLYDNVYPALTDDVDPVEERLRIKEEQRDLINGYESLENQAKNLKENKERIKKLYSQEAYIKELNELAKKYKTFNQEYKNSLNRNIQKKNKKLGKNDIFNNSKSESDLIAEWESLH
jgi:hypothetical protein